MPSAAEFSTPITKSGQTSRRTRSIPRSASPRKSGINGTARRSQGLDLHGGAVEIPEVEEENEENDVSASKSGVLEQSIGSQRKKKTPLRDLTAIGTTSRSIETPTRTERSPPLSGVPPSEGVETYNVAEALELYTPNDGAEFEQEDNDSFDNEETGLGQDGCDEQEAEPSPRALRSPDSPLPSVEAFEPTKANSRRKRRSDLRDGGSNKRQRQFSQTKTDHTGKQPSPSRLPDQAATSVAMKSKDSRAPNKLPNASGMAFSAGQEQEIEQIVEKVRARPGQAKSLYILRRETPADGDAVHTRSGRVSVKPLAYWRNERCIFGGSPSQSQLADGARFPLNSIKEIIRTNEVEAESSTSRRKERRTKTSKKSKVSPVDEHDDESDSEAEEWESTEGVFRGPVSGWDVDLQGPLEVQEEADLAYAPAMIQTREVPNATFKYAKLLSLPFFGAGVVDLIPGGVKRPKNSRKMHMCFFVAKGRVKVEVGVVGGESNVFSVGKGGFWQVPRGKSCMIDP